MTKLIIDVQNAINLYNQKYPKQKPLTKSELSKITGIKKQFFIDVENGKVPQTLYIIYPALVSGAVSFSKFTENVNNKKTTFYRIKLIMEVLECGVLDLVKEVSIND